MAAKKNQISSKQNVQVGANIDLLVNKISHAALANITHLNNHFDRSYDNDHTHINSFQKGICDWLNNDSDVQGWYQSWQIEVKPNGRIERDSIDIMGSPKAGNIRCIVEIDACRSDQVAAKYLSRLALWGLDQPVLYIALLYPRPHQNNVYACEKNVFYANTVIKKMNSKSKAVGVYVDIDTNNNGYAQIWDYNLHSSFVIKTRRNINQCVGMPKCANAAIREYVITHSHKTYEELRGIFGKYISDEVGKARYRKLDLKSADGISLFSYSDFRGKGPRSLDWHIFTGICSNIGINISRVWPVIV